MRDHLRTRALVACLVGTCLAAPAFAQDSAQAVFAEADDQDEATSEQRGVDEILVTARRRAERLQDVPLAIAALGSEQLERDNIEGISDLDGRVPGLVVGNSLGGGSSTPVFAIRGQSQQELASIADPSVTLYVNDIPIPRAHGSNLGFFDIGSVEVLKGPQGTLFGRNTTGGAILVRTNQPSNQFEGSISQTLGNFNLFSTEAMINLPFGEDSALRVAGQHTQRDGYIFDSVTGDDINTLNEDALRASLKLGSDNVTSTTTFAYSHADNGGTGGILIFAPHPLFTGYVEEQATRDIYHTASGVPMFSRIKTFSVDNQTSFDISQNLTIKNIVGYRQLDLHSLEDLDATSDIIFPVERIVRQEQITEELQLQGSFDRFDFIVGAFYFREQGSDQALTAGKLTGTVLVDPGAIEPDSISGFYPNYSNTWVKPTNTSYAIFAHGSFEVTDRLAVTAGARMSWDKREVNTLNRSYISAISTTDQSCRFTLDQDNDPSTPETRPALEDCVFVGDETFSEPTYNLSVQYRLGDDALVYAAHRHGYRTGGFAARQTSEALLSETFEPELVDDFEIGLKADWYFGDSFLRTNIAAYHAKYKDLQRILTRGIAPPVTIATNAGRSRIQGIEVDVLFRPIDMLDLSVSYAYTDGEFLEYLTPNGDDISGQVFPRTPKHQLNANAGLTVLDTVETGELRFGVGFRYQDSYDYNDDYAFEVLADGSPNPAGIAVNQAQIIESYQLWSANAEWSNFMGSNFNISAFADNLTDEEYLIPYMGIQNLYEARAPGKPRTYGVKLSYNFN